MRIPRDAITLESPAAAPQVILTTTPTIEGMTIRHYHGIVTGEAIVGANIFRDLFPGIRDVVGGRSLAYEKELRKAREIALRSMAKVAQGGNAVVGIDLDYEVVGRGSMLMVAVSGTAVSVE